MRNHAIAVGCLHIVAGLFVFGCVAVIWGAAALLAPTFAGTFVPGLIAMFGRPVAVILLAIGGLEAVAGAALLREHVWPRIALCCIGVLQMAIFPIGTGIAAYTFWFLLRSRRTPPDMPVGYQPVPRA